MSRFCYALAPAVLAAGCVEEVIAPDVPPANQPPVVSKAILDQRLVGPGDRATLDVAGHFSDPDGNTLTYQSASTDTAIVEVSIAESKLTLMGGTVGGTARVAVTARDTQGAEAQATFGVVVNRQPVASGGIPAQTLWHGATRVDVDLAGVFADPDGDSLHFAVTSADTSVVSAVLYPGPIIGLASPARGEATVTVTAHDPDGLEARAVVSVLVVENPDLATLTERRQEFVVVSSHSGTPLTGMPENWDAGLPLGEWYGVDVNASGRVTCLGSCWADQGGGLERVGLHGTVPPELGRFDALEFLFLFVGGRGPIPGELGALANLKFLRLDGWMTGQIPPELDKLAALEWLDLRGWHLSGPIPPGLQNLGQLERLNISGATGRVTNGSAGGYVDLCVESASLGVWLTETMGWSPTRVRPCFGRAHLVQVVQSDDGSVPMVAERPAALRLLDIPPPARTRFFLAGVEVHVEEVYEIAFDAIDGANASPDTIAPAATIPASVIQPGLEMVVEWEQGRFPSVGRKTIEVRRIPPLDLTLVPLVWENPDRDDNVIRSLLDRVARMASDLNNEGFELLPAHEVRAKTHAVVGVVEATGRRVNSSANYLNAVTSARRRASGTGYWMGIVDGGEEGQQGGLAILGGHVAFANNRLAVEHELGHNLGLGHPVVGFDQLGLRCDAVQDGDYDPHYPHEGGAIGAWGYNLQDAMFVPPHTPDLMTYCEPGYVATYPHYGVWVSDYHYKKALNRRIRDAEPHPSR